MPRFPDVSEDPICWIPGVTRQRQGTKSGGGSLRVLGGPFNLEQDPCQWLELRRQHPAAKLHGMSSARACCQGPSQLGWSSRQVSKCSRGTKVLSSNKEMKSVLETVTHSVTEQAKTIWTESFSLREARLMGARLTTNPGEVPSGLTRE